MSTGAEAGDGYISDVPTQASNANSDISHELVESAKMLEKEFRDKYKVLRNAYEHRIRQVSEVVQDTCSHLFSDELLTEMKSDKLTATFIPAHLSEIIERQLQSESEKYMHQMIDKVSSTELQLSKANGTIARLTNKVSENEQELSRAKLAEAALPSLNEKIKDLDIEYRNYVQRTEIELANLRNQNENLTLKEKQLANQLEIASYKLAEKTRECEHLHSSVEAKSRDIDMLEQSFTQNARELAIIENMDKQEQVLKQEMRQQIHDLTVQRNALYDEVHQMRAKLLYASEEVERCHSLQQERENDEQANKERIAALMQQVEGMLSQEASESNAAITAVHEKMKAFRQRMTAELHREKRLTAALQEELATMKALKEDEVREIKRLRDMEDSLRGQLQQEQQKESTLQHQIKECSSELTTLHVKLAEAEAQAKQAQHISGDYERIRQLETSLVEERARLQAERQKEAELKQIEDRTAAHRMHYQNELGSIQNQLRHSYTFGANEETNLSTELSFKQTVEHWVQETGKLKMKHIQDIRAMEKQREVDVAAAERRARRDSEEALLQLQGRLQEASGHISTLKSMVQEARHKINSKDAIIAQLTAEASRVSAVTSTSLVSQQLLQQQLFQQQQLNHSNVQIQQPWQQSGLQRQPRVQQVAKSMSNVDLADASYSANNDLSAAETAEWGRVTSDAGSASVSGPVSGPGVQCVRADESTVDMSTMRGSSFASSSFDALQPQMARSHMSRASRRGSAGTAPASSVTGAAGLGHSSFGWKPSFGIGGKQQQQQYVGGSTPLSTIASEDPGDQSVATPQGAAASSAAAGSGSSTAGQSTLSSHKMPMQPSTAYQGGAGRSQPRYGQSSADRVVDADPASDAASVMSALFGEPSGREVGATESGRSELEETLQRELAAALEEGVRQKAQADRLAVQAEQLRRDLDTVLAAQPPPKKQQTAETATSNQVEQKTEQLQLKVQELELELLSLRNQNASLASDNADLLTSTQRLQQQLVAGAGATTTFTSASTAVSASAGGSVTAKLDSGKDQDESSIGSNDAALYSVQRESEISAQRMMRELQAELGRQQDKLTHQQQQVQELEVLLQQKDRLLDDQRTRVVELQRQLEAQIALNVSAAANTSSQLVLESSVSHQVELAELASSELGAERSRMREMRKREIKLFALLAQVETIYKTELQKLRQELTGVRCLVQSLAPSVDQDIHSTVSGLGAKLKIIFDKLQQKQSGNELAARKALSRAHQAEMDALEARFVAQLSAQSKAHAQELESMHAQVVGQAEQAISMSDASLLDVSADRSHHTSSSSSSSSWRGKGQGRSGLTVSFAVGDERKGDDAANDDGDDHHDDSAADVGVTTSSINSGSSSNNSGSSRPPLGRRSRLTAAQLAYESVLRGVLEALVAEDVLDSNSSGQISALAEAHNEPSFAALAASKALLSGQLEQFVLRLKRSGPSMNNAAGFHDGGDVVEPLHTSSGHIDFSSFYG